MTEKIVKVAGWTWTKHISGQWDTGLANEDDPDPDATVSDVPKWHDSALDRIYELEHPGEKT